MKKSEKHRVVTLFSLSMAFSGLLSAQQVICVDSTHYDFNQACLAIFDPVCGCDHSIPSNACYAFAYDALSCWTGACPEVNKGCEVKIEYAIEGGELHLTNQSIVGAGDSITFLSWQNNYEQFSQQENPVFNMPPGETAFKISLQIRTRNGCDAFCTYLIQRSIDALGEPAAPEGPRAFPNPASGKLFLESEKPLVHLQMFSLSGREQLRIALNGAQQPEVNVSSMPPGLYILALYDGERVYYRKVALQ